MCTAECGKVLVHAHLSGVSPLVSEPDARKVQPQPFALLHCSIHIPLIRLQAVYIFFTRTCTFLELESHETLNELEYNAVHPT